MRFLKAFSAGLGLFSLYVLAETDILSSRSEGIDPFTNATVFQPTNNRSSVSYARTETLPGNTLLATWTDFGSNGSLPIYRSKDSGRTWQAWGTCKSYKPGRLLLQPHLLYLEDDFGDRIGGILLLAVNAVDRNSTNIEVYASEDEGRSFEIVSLVAEGGRANTTNGATPVWEPFLLRHGNKLTIYYSDQRDPNHGQKLVQQTTRGGFTNWGPVVDVVASAKYTDRPGMLVVTKLPNHQYFMVFEYAMQVNETTNHYKYPIYYKLADDAENANDAAWHRLVVDTGAQPDSGPYATWSSVGGENGTIVVSDSENRPVWVNQMLGQGVWKQLDTPHGRAYSREVRVPVNDDSKIRITGGAEYNATPPTRVEVTVIDLEKDLGA